MNLKLFLPAILTIALLAACSKDDVDTTRPVITLTTPADKAVFHRGQTVNLSALLTDNEELSSWKVSVHFNPYGHVHAAGAVVEKSSTQATATNNWQFSANGTITPGLREFTLAREILIPQDATLGEYHLGVFAIDKSGNETQLFIEIKVHAAI